MISALHPKEKSGLWVSTVSDWLLRVKIGLLARPYLPAYKKTTGRLSLDSPAGYLH